MPQTIGGDAEGYMDPPTQQLATLTEVMGLGGGGGGNVIASLLDLVGLHRQVAKGPKTPDVPQPQAVVPQVLTDVESALGPTETPVLPPVSNSPMTTWGARWIESLKPITSIDPNSAL